MDTVYGTKKYFQSLSGNRNIYSNDVCRTMPNDFTYQNALGRRSQLQGYYHMNKQPYFSNDLNISNSYGYNSWEILSEARNIDPSTFSARKTRPNKSNCSFSLILTTAVLIVILALISIAALALYFSEMQINSEEPVLGFEGSFYVVKGDPYTSSLKYNNTMSYKQKIEFYKKFIEQALGDNGLKTLRNDVWGFGDGPSIKVSFRIYFDVRKIPLNIRNVEEFIKDSLLLHTLSAKSLYHSLRLDVKTIEIKRLIHEEVARTVSLWKQTQNLPVQQTRHEKRPITAGEVLLSEQPKESSTTTHISESKTVASESSAPVIHGSFEGSFEITKTDADISRRKIKPTVAYQNSSPAPLAITPVTMRVKSKLPSIVKLNAIAAQPNSKLESSSEPATVATTVSSKTLNAIATKSINQKITSTTIPTTSPKPTVRTLSQSPNLKNIFGISTSEVLPKLDANLFTSMPILDTQPWRPINRQVPELLPGPPPAFPTQNLSPLTSIGMPGFQIPLVAQSVLQRRFDKFELPFVSDNLPPTTNTYSPNSFLNSHNKLYLFKNNSTKPLTYQNFGVPAFWFDNSNIEHLGNGVSVKPHPLPVPLIDEVIAPLFDPTLDPTEKYSFNIETSGTNVDQLESAVDVNNQEVAMESQKLNPNIKFNVNSTSGENNYSLAANIKNKLSDDATISKIEYKIADMMEELFNLTKEENRNSTKPTNSPTEGVRVSAGAINLKEKPLPTPIFLNIKEIILKNALANNQTKKTNLSNLKITRNSTTTEHTSISPVKINQTYTVFNDSQLFPSSSKWELLNSSSSSNKHKGHTGNIRKVFNKTLQAFVSEDVNKSENPTLSNMKTHINASSDIRDISLVFDNLSSKLGLNPTVSTKFPPFAENKHKFPQISPIATSPTFKTPTKGTEWTKVPLTRGIPTIKPLDSFVDEVNSSSQEVSDVTPVVGKAEVEVIDPNIYGDMLISSRFKELMTIDPEVPELVTLLPARSNSGIRPYGHSTDNVNKQRSLSSFWDKAYKDLNGNKFSAPPDGEDYSQRD